MKNTESVVTKGFEYAKEIYAGLGVDLEAAMKAADGIPISMHCWQGDDFHGTDGQDLNGGIAVTGNYPGCARNCDELREDIARTLTLIPGATKLNLHSNYAEDKEAGTDRDSIRPEHFSRWIDFAKQQKMGLDFNPTFFSHPRMDGNFTLASPKREIRDFWIEHGKRCREIGDAMGRAIGDTCIVNYWMPDGFKDIPVDTTYYRSRMAEALDEIFSDRMDERYMRESIESKLFGFGIESYTVASHEFSLGYAITRKKTYCLDFGHFHPTESIADKISAALIYVPSLLLHVSRGVRWDSDHVPLYDDELQRIMREVVVGGYLDRIYIAQDYFDGSINRIACWTIAMRNTRRALLKAMTDPTALLKQAEERGNLSKRLALLEENKTLPFSAVWDYYCLKSGKPVGYEWYDRAEEYEREVLSKR